MSATDRPDSKLPVTGEVGSEGGSYAEPTRQVATFSGPANPNVSPADAIADRMSVATEASAQVPLQITSVAGDGDTSSEMIRYPTEPPSPPDAREGRKLGAHPWRNGLIGLAAGTAALIGVARLRRRRQ